MRYKRLLFGDVCLATDVGEGSPALLSARFLCPVCGTAWGTLDAGPSNQFVPGQLSASYFFVTTPGPCAPHRLIAHPGEPGRPSNLRVPGSFFTDALQWWTPREMGRLLLAFPLLAAHETAAHALTGLLCAPTN